MGSWPYCAQSRRGESAESEETPNESDENLSDELPSDDSSQLESSSTSRRKPGTMPRRGAGSLLHFNWWPP
jgi:hypothetical protein